MNRRYSTAFLKRESASMYLPTRAATDDAGIELGVASMVADYVPSKSRNVKFNVEASQNKIEAEDDGVIFFDRFQRILEDEFVDNKSWWEVAEETATKDSEVAENVERKVQARGEMYRRQSVVEVVVDILIAMERTTLSKALILTLNETSMSPFPKKLFSKELLRRGADPNSEVGAYDQSPLHLAASQGLVSVVKLLLKKKARIEKKDDSGETPLVKAVYYEHTEVARVLIEDGADIYACDSSDVPCFHLAAQCDEADLIQLFLDKHSNLDEPDSDGRSPLHHAAYYSTTDTMTALLEAGASVNSRDRKKRTPLHVVAKDGFEDEAELLLSNGADPRIQDFEGCTALDLAAREQNESVFEMLVSHSSVTSHDANHLELVEKRMKGNRVKDDFIAARLKEMSPMAVVDMVKPTALYGDGTFNLVNDFIKAKGLRESTRAVMDHFILGKRRVNCEILDADCDGFPPDHELFNPSAASLLDAIVDTDNQDLARHPAIKAIVDHKWKRYVRWKFLLSFGVYLTRTILFALALLIAARPDLDNPGCYRNGWDVVRGILEGITLIFFVGKWIDEIVEFYQYKKEYLKDYYNWLQVAAITMPFTIIPFRVATTWCASTGVGYCALPSINATDINVSCIVASHVQWIFAAVAYLLNAFLILEFLALFKLTGVYVRILIQIIKSDIFKFSILYFVFLFFFVGAFYFALRAGVTITADGQIISDTNRFSLETLYPWNVLFTGVRILVESEGIIEGYFSSDDNDVYVGYQWFAVAMYMLFLFVVIVVLLNLLIAQMSDSYTKIQEDVAGTFAMARVRTVARLQKGGMCGTNQRHKYYEKHLWLDVHEEEKTREEQNTATIASLSERMDKLSKMTEILVDEMLRGKKMEAEQMMDDYMGQETLDKLEQLPDLTELSDLDISTDDDDDDDGNDDDDDDDGGGSREYLDDDSDDGLLSGDNND